MSRAVSSIPVWDLPTRLFHWALVLLVAGGWLSQKYGAVLFGDIMMSWHKWNGYTLLTLLLFRILWGFVGTSTARFTDFFPTPARLWRYFSSGLRSKYAGHNPLGALSVFALLGLVSLQAFSGLFTTDDILVNGPLRWQVSAELASLFDTLHSRAFDILLVLIVIHIAAIAFYRFVARDDLLTPMLTGRKTAHQVPADASIKFRSLWLALGCLIVAAVLVWLGVNFGRW
jgi:cytochrome b